MIDWLLNLSFKWLCIWFIVIKILYFHILKSYSLRVVILLLQGKVINITLIFLNMKRNCLYFIIRMLLLSSNCLFNFDCIDFVILMGLFIQKAMLNVSMMLVWELNRLLLFLFIDFNNFVNWFIILSLLNANRSLD